MGGGKGGPALWRTLNGYTEHGWNVFFITSNHAHGNLSKLPDNLRVIRFDAPLLKKLMGIKKVGFFAKTGWWLYFQLVAFVKSIQLVWKHKIDVIYGYEISGIPAAKVLSKLLRVPIVSRFQGTILVQAMELPFWKVRMWDHVLGLSIHVDLLIMTNDGTQGDRVLKKLGVNMDKVKFWMNGLDRKVFDKMPEKQEAKKILDLSDKRILLTVSRLVKWKHVERSIDALPDVVKDFPNTVLIVVGDGPEKDKLKQLVHELKLEQYIRFVGAVPHEEISKYYVAADIFLSFYDLSNVGNPLLEAMVCGKCIVTLNNGDTGRFIRNEYNGVLLGYDNLPSLSEIIKSLLSDEARRKQLGTNARKFAEKHFWTWQERIETEIQEVTNLINRWKKS